MELLTVLGLGFGIVASLAWYYIIFIIGVLLFFTAFANDNDEGLEGILFVVILVALGYALWGQISITDAILAIVYYLLLGSVWSVFNYAFTIRGYMVKAKARKQNDYDLSYFQDKISRSRIARWVLYFPFSMFEYIVGQFFVNIIKRLVNMMGGTYNRIANHYYKKFFQ